MIERRGEPVAEFRRFKKPSKKPRFADMERIWREFPQVPGDSGKFLEEDR